MKKYLVLIAFFIFTKTGYSCSIDLESLQSSTDTVDIHGLLTKTFQGKPIIPDFAETLYVKGINTASPESPEARLFQLSFALSSETQNMRNYWAQLGLYSTGNAIFTYLFDRIYETPIPPSFPRKKLEEYQLLSNILPKKEFTRYLDQECPEEHRPHRYIYQKLLLASLRDSSSLKEAQLKELLKDGEIGSVKFGFLGGVLTLSLSSSPMPEEIEGEVSSVFLKHKRKRDQGITSTRMITQKEIHTVRFENAEELFEKLQEMFEAYMLTLYDLCNPENRTSLGGAYT